MFHVAFVMDWEYFTRYADIAMIVQQWNVPIKKTEHFKYKTTKILKTENKFKYKS